jgi:hypothetical protein
MNLVLVWINAQLAQAKTPEDVFGDLKGNRAEQAAALKQVYHHLARVTHPDVFSAAEDQPIAQLTFTRLSQWFAFAEEKINQGEYGKKPGSVDHTAAYLRSSKHEYVVAGSSTEQEIYQSYPCSYQQGSQTIQAVLKIVRHPQDNDLAQNEAAVLQTLTSGTAADRYLPYLPHLEDSFIYSESGVERFANVFAETSGWFSLEQVRQAYPAGIDPKDMAWMWRRLLVALGFAHLNEILHGAVLPVNVLIHPAQHGLMLVNWAYAVRAPQTIQVVTAGYEAWYPLEVIRSEQPLPATDIDLAAKCMIYLLGGSPTRRTFPPTVPGPIQGFLKGCTLPGKNARPQDAWALMEEFDELLEKLYGERKFHPFYMQSNPN